MRRRLACWAFRRLVAPTVVGYLVGDKVTGNRMVFTPEEVTLVFGSRRRDLTRA